MDAAVVSPKLHIILRNLIRDRTSGSTEEYQTLGGHKHISTICQVDTSKGVDSGDVARRRAEYGSNEPPAPEKTSYFGFICDAFSDFTVIMLCCAAGVSLILAFTYEKTAGAYAEGFAILISVLLVTNVTAINDYRKQAQFLQLNAAVDDVSVRCYRDGVIGDVRSADLVCGDIVQLNVGDILTVDGVLFSADGVSTDESALTGEPKLIRKDPVTAPFLLSGTKVMEGSGTFIVIAVGDNSEAGQIRELIRNAKSKPKAVAADDALDTAVEEELSMDSPEAKSVLTAKLDRIAILVGKGATVIAIVALIVMCVRYAVQTFALTNPDTLCAEVSNELCSSQAVWDYAPDPAVGFPYCSTLGHSSPCCTDTTDGAEITGSPCPWMKNHLGEFLSFLITAITILVVAVPEGLPLAVTLSLAFSVRQMMNENNLVKHLDACETMGSATTICSDKTGTLTKNRMTVVRSMVGIDKAVTLKSPSITPDLKQIIAEAICLSGNSDIVWNPQLKLWDQIGSKTECALLQCIKDDLNMGESYSEIRSSAQPRIVKKFPFASAAKKSGFLIRSNDIVRLVTVGASEMILEHCGFYMDPHTGTTPLSGSVRSQIEKTIEEFANLAMRTVCIAYKDFAGALNTDSVSVEEMGLIFVALVGIEDPLRDEVPDAIRKCNRAGVDVKMVTGDNFNTAIAIARNCNIIRSSDFVDAEMKTLRANVAMTGPDFRKAVLDAQGNIRQAELDRIWPTLRVLARSSPTDKYILVSGMIDSSLVIGDSGDRQVVAVTGDGTNDAPALKKADVGFAMGVTGTAVARDAADIILMDDNFASIVVACKWGRNVFDSIAKFLQFQLTVNVVAVVIAIEGAFINNESPIGAVQMLWVNLIMDALASLALATEPPTDALLDRKPQGRHTSAISNIMTWNILGQAVFQLLVLNLIFFMGPEWLDIESGVGKGHNAPPSEHYTMMFNVLVVMQLTNQINSRKLHHELNVFKGLWDNMFFISIIAAEAVLQVIFVQFGGDWVSTTALSGWFWGLSAAISLCSFPVYWLIVALRKMVLRRMKKRTETAHAKEIEAAPPTTKNNSAFGASVISPLPTAATKKPHLVTQSADNLGRLASGSLGSGSLKAFSAKNFRDIVTVPGVEELKRTKTGGFKNPRRQAANNQRFRKLYSFSDSSAAAAGQASASEFVQAAKAYHKEN